MLKPDKHTNLKISIFNIAGIILKALQKEEILKYDELLTIVINETDESSKKLFPLANSFLYLLNKIEYFADIDSFRLNHETN